MPAQLLYPKLDSRDYQIEACDAYLTCEELAALVQLATGLGKTFLAGLIFGRIDGKCLFLAHTDELVRQTCRTMLRLGLWPNVEKADEYRGGPYLPDARERRKLFPNGFPPNDWFIFGKVVVSSMQTFVTRMEKYADIPFAITCIDEAHRSRCRTYERIVDRLYLANKAMRLLGLTATPYRADKKNLGTLFPAFAYRMPILDAIDRGWLVDVRGVEVQMKADAGKWKVGATSHGKDITDSSLRASMQSDECIESIAYPILERGEDRKGIVFLPGVEAAEAVAAALNHLKPNYATFVHGGVPKKERRRRVRQFEDGETRVMTGCNVMVEGFDVPDVSLVVMARPTQSRGLYEQMLGRGLRPLADAIAGKPTAAERRQALAASAKKDCLVIDFANTTRFKLVNALDVVLTGADDDAKRDYIARQMKDRDPADRRAIREQLGELEALYALSDALNTAGGPPPRQDYTAREISLYDAGGVAASAPTAPAARPGPKLVADAHQFLIDRETAERATAAELAAEIGRRKEKMVGRRNFGFLKGLGIDPKAERLNWHDAEYLKRLTFARPAKDVPDNWRDLVTKERIKRKAGGK